MCFSTETDNLCYDPLPGCVCLIVEVLYRYCRTHSTAPCTKWTRRHLLVRGDGSPLRAPINVGPLVINRVWLCLRRANPGGSSTYSAQRHGLDKSDRCHAIMLPTAKWSTGKLPGSSNCDVFFFLFRRRQDMFNQPVSCTTTCLKVSQ